MPRRFEHDPGTWGRRGGGWWRRWT
jgi:hypothetical protein